MHRSSNSCHFIQLAPVFHAPLVRCALRAATAPIPASASVRPGRFKSTRSAFSRVWAVEAMVKRESREKMSSFVFLLFSTTKFAVHINERLYGRLDLSQWSLFMSNRLCVTRKSMRDERELWLGNLFLHCESWAKKSTPPFRHAPSYELNAPPRGVNFLSSKD